MDVLFRCVSLFLLDGLGARSFSESLASPSKDGGAFRGGGRHPVRPPSPFSRSIHQRRGPTRIPLLLLLSYLRVYKLTRFVLGTHSCPPDLLILILNKAFVLDFPSRILHLLFALS